MASDTLALTHYWPSDLDIDLVDEQAACGVAMEHDAQHSLRPTCPTCAAYLAAEDYTVDVLPALTAQADARTRPISPLGRELMALATTLAYVQLAQGRRR